MRFLNLAVLALCTLGLGSANAQETPAPAAANIDYSILGQPANAAKANLTDEQRAKITEILDQRVSDLVAAEPGDREAIVAKSNADIEALLSAEQKQALADSLSQRENCSLTFTNRSGLQS